MNAYEILGDVTTRRQYDVMQRIAAVQKDKPIKATTATKHTSSTVNVSSGYIPVDPLSDPALASLVSTRGLMSYTIKQMKVMLVARRLPVSGSKAELIERLENYVNGVKKVKEPRIPQPSQPQHHQRQYQQAPSGIPEGYLVRLHGLTTSYYNGKMAVVKSSVNENGRQLVELLGKLDSSLNQIYVKPGNMMVVRRVVVDSDSGEDDDWHGWFHHIRQPQQPQQQPQPQPQQQQQQQQQPQQQNYHQQQQYQPPQPPQYYPSQHQQHQYQHPQAQQYQPQYRPQYPAAQYRPQYQPQHPPHAQSAWV